MSPAFKLFAKAVGVSTAELDKMLVNGQVFSDVYLPKFAKELKNFAKNGLDKALQSSQARWNQMISEFKDAALAMFGGTQEGFDNLMVTIKNFLITNAPLWKSLGSLIGGFFKILSVGIALVTPLFIGLGKALEFVTETFGDFGTLLLLPMIYVAIGKIGALTAAYLGLAKAATTANIAQAGGAGGLGGAVGGKGGGMLGKLALGGAAVGTGSLALGLGVAAVTAYLAEGVATWGKGNLQALDARQKASAAERAATARINATNPQAANGSNQTITVITQLDSDVVAEKVVSNQRMENAMDQRLRHSNS